MKILVSCIPDPLNYGNAMMAINLIERLGQVDPTAEFYVDVNTDEGLDRLKRSLTVDRVFRTDVEYRLFRHAPIRFLKGVSYVKGLRSYCKEVGSKFDAVMFVGGDDLSEGYSKSYALLTMTKISCLARRIPVFLVGQSIGPFTSIRHRLGGVLLRDAWIYARDPVTYEYLSSELRLSRVFLRADLAFLDLPRQEEVDKNALFRRLGIPWSDYITVVPSGYIKMYSRNRKAYVQGWVEIIYELLGHEALAGRPLVLLPHVLKKDVDDRVLIGAIMNEVDRDSRERVWAIEREILPREARALLGWGYMTITGRMHAAISTFQRGKPAISLSYSPKYRGVIAEGMGLPELVIECGDTAAWSSGKIVSEIGNRVRAVGEDYMSFVERVQQAVWGAQQSVEIMLSDIMSRVGIAKADAVWRAASAGT